jgi:hypothetical protein
MTRCCSQKLCIISPSYRVGPLSPEGLLLLQVTVESVRDQAMARFKLELLQDLLIGQAQECFAGFPPTPNALLGQVR